MLLIGKLLYYSNTINYSPELSFSGWSGFYITYDCWVYLKIFSSMKCRKFLLCLTHSDHKAKQDKALKSFKMKS